MLSQCKSFFGNRNLVDGKYFANIGIARWDGPIRTVPPATPSQSVGCISISGDMTSIWIFDYLNILIILRFLHVLIITSPGLTVIQSSTFLLLLMNPQAFSKTLLDILFICCRRCSKQFLQIGTLQGFRGLIVAPFQGEPPKFCIAMRMFEMI